LLCAAVEALRHLKLGRRETIVGWAKAEKSLCVASEPKNNIRTHAPLKSFPRLPVNYMPYYKLAEYPWIPSPAAQSSSDRTWIAGCRGKVLIFVLLFAHLSKTGNVNRGLLLQVCILLVSWPSFRGSKAPRASGSNYTSSLIYQRSHSSSNGNADVGQDREVTGM